MENLKDRLLNQPVRDGRYPQQTGSAFGFGYLYAAYRCRSIAPFEQLLFDLRPLLLEQDGRLTNAQAIDARGSLVRFTRDHARCMFDGSTTRSIKSSTESLTWVEVVTDT